MIFPSVPFDLRGDRVGATLYRIASSHEVPDYAKQASTDDVYGTPELPREAYADQVTRQFPCHTKAATWWSAAAFADCREQLPADVSKRAEVGLRRLSALHDMADQVSALLSPVKQADAPLQDDDFAICEKLADGTVFRALPLKNASEVKAAADYLEANRTSLPYADRQAAALKVLRKAAVLGVDLCGRLDKQAGFAEGSWIDARTALSRRAALLLSVDRELSGVLREAADACCENAAVGVKMATLVADLDWIDRVHGLTQFYGSSIDEPEALLTVTAKSASDFLDEHCQTTTGNVYRVSDFYKAGAGAVRDIFGEEFVREVTDGGVLSAAKLAVQAAALPRPDAELFDRLMAAVGVEPIMKQASSGGWGLPGEALRTLASMDV